MPKVKTKSGPYSGPYARSGSSSSTAEPNPPIIDHVLPSTSNEAAGANNDHPATNYATGKLDCDNQECLSDMESDDKLRLTANWTFLVENIQADQILDHLYGEHVLSEEDFERIEKMDTNKSKVRKILQTLPKQGAYAYKAFKTVLQEKQTFVVHTLDKTDLAEARKKLEAAKESSNNIDSSKSEILKHHNKLSIVLNRRITTFQLKELKQFFSGTPIEEGEADEIEDFLDLWKLLERYAVIKVQEYGELADAFDSILKHCHVDVIEEFEEKMMFEGEPYVGWVTHNKKTLTKAKLLELMKGNEPLMRTHGTDHGTVHVYENAVYGLIRLSEGGQLRFKNGTAKLQIPPYAIPDKDQEMFWIFRPAADTDEDERSQLAVCSQEGQSLKNFDNVVKYSLQVTLGPQDVAFNKTALPKLTLKEYSFPDLTTSSADWLLVYRRAGDNGTWEKVGTLDKESRSVSLTKFSSYVLGMPATSELLPLNVHILVERLSEKKDVTSQPRDTRVVFSMNDHTYIQEMVSRKRMNIVCETSYYLDPKCDVYIRWERQNADGSVYLKQMAVLEKGRLNSLAEKVQTVTIPTHGNARYDEESTDFVIFEQNDTQLVELFCRDDRHMEKKQKVNVNRVRDATIENVGHEYLKQHLDEYFEENVKLNAEEMKQATKVAMEISKHLLVHLKNRFEFEKLNLAPIEPVGSSFDGLKVAPPDEFDMIIPINLSPYAWELIDGRTAVVEGKKLDAPGFWLIKKKTKRTPNMDPYLTNKQDGDYVAPGNLIRDLQRKIHKFIRKFKNPEGVESVKGGVKGPSMYMQVEYTTTLGPKRKFDLNFVLEIRVGDSSDIPKLVAKRHPSITQQGFMGDNPVALLWQESSAKKESERIRQIREECPLDCRKKCWKLVKALAMKNRHLGSVCTYFYKTLFLHLLDEIPNDADWHDTKLADRFVDVFKKMEDVLHWKWMPLYFTQDVNMLLPRYDAMQVENVFYYVRKMNASGSYMQMMYGGPSSAEKKPEKQFTVVSGSRRRAGNTAAKATAPKRTRKAKAPKKAPNKEQVKPRAPSRQRTGSSASSFA